MKQLKKINDWISENTGGKINNYISNNLSNSEIKLFLFNAIYLKDTWRKLPQGIIENDDFKLTNGSLKKVSIARNAKRFFVAAWQSVCGLLRE